MKDYEITENCVLRKGQAIYRISTKVPDGNDHVVITVEQDMALGDQVDQDRRFGAMDALLGDVLDMAGPGDIYDTAKQAADAWLKSKEPSNG